MKLLHPSRPLVYVAAQGLCERIREKHRFVRTTPRLLQHNNNTRLERERSSPNPGGRLGGRKQCFGWAVTLPDQHVNHAPNYMCPNAIYGDIKMVRESRAPHPDHRTEHVQMQPTRESDTSHKLEWRSQTVRANGANPTKSQQDSPLKSWAHIDPWLKNTVHDGNLNHPYAREHDPRQPYPPYAYCTSESSCTVCLE